MGNLGYLAPAAADRFTELHTDPGGASQKYGLA
jgi:hypothetical protein